MKVYLFILTVVLSFAACSKHQEPNVVEPDYSQMTEEECIAYAHSIGAITLEDYHEMVVASIDQEENNRVDPGHRQAILGERSSATGFDSHYKLSNIPAQKVLIYEASDEIPRGIYLLMAYLVEKKILCEADMLYAVADSPLCGFRPQGNGRGYAGHMSSGYWKMRSIAYYIKHNVIGRPINRFYPLEPSHFVWNYQASTLQ